MLVMVANINVTIAHLLLWFSIALGTRAIQLQFYCIVISQKLIAFAILAKTKENSVNVNIIFAIKTKPNHTFHSCGA